MSTRSRIGIKNSDGSVSSIYCHFDGYVAYVGRMLQEHYQDEDKIRALIALGDLSILDASIDKPDGHSFASRIDGYTVAYGRDRGEDKTDARKHSLTSWPDYGQEYEYLNQDGVWYYRKTYERDTAWLPLKDAVAALR